MWEVLSKIVPPPVLAGFLIYTAVTAIWLQPIVETRISEIKLIPACKADRLPKVAAIPPMPENRVEGEIVNGVQREVSGSLPLGIQIMMGLKGMMGSDYDPYGKYVRRSGGDACLCSVSLAFDTVYWKHLGHVMTLRFYTPYAIKHLDERVSANLASGHCGKQ